MKKVILQMKNISIKGLFSSSNFKNCSNSFFLDATKPRDTGFGLEFFLEEKDLLEQSHIGQNFFNGQIYFIKYKLQFVYSMILQYSVRCVLV